MTTPDKEAAVTSPRKLIEETIEELYELKGERDWWKGEPRGGYQARYAVLLRLIEQLEELLK